MLAVDTGRFVKRAKIDFHVDIVAHLVEALESKFFYYFLGWNNWKSMQNWANLPQGIPSECAGQGLWQLTLLVAFCMQYYYMHWNNKECKLAYLEEFMSCKRFVCENMWAGNWNFLLFLQFSCFSKRLASNSWFHSFIHSFIYLAIKLIRDWNNKALQFILVFASARLLFASWRFGEVTMLCLESFHKFSVVFMERFKFCRGFAILSPARVVRIQFSSKINNYVIFFVSLSSNWKKTYLSCFEKTW